MVHATICRSSGPPPLQCRVYYWGSQSLLNQSVLILAFCIQESRGKLHCIDCVSMMSRFKDLFVELRTEIFRLAFKGLYKYNREPFSSDHGLKCFTRWLRAYKWIRTEATRLLFEKKTQIQCSFQSHSVETPKHSGWTNDRSIVLHITDND